MPINAMTDKVPRIGIPHAQALIASMKARAEQKGITWEIPLDENGMPQPGRDWDLRKLNDSHNRHAAGTGGFSVYTEIRQLAVDAGWPSARLPASAILSLEAQDFIKSLIVDRCLRGRTADSTQTIANAAKRLLSSTSAAPDQLTREHFEAFLALKNWSEKFVRDVLVVAKFIDTHLLSTNCPVKPAVAFQNKPELLEDLKTRGGDKLPDKLALFELSRIVFQERPGSFNHFIYFAVFRLLIMTGLRISEVLSLPEDCLVWDEHIDILTGMPAASAGGISRSLRLRYFAAKQRDGTPGILVERFYFVPAQFETLVSQTVRDVQSNTAHLRATLKMQSDGAALAPNSDVRTFMTSTGQKIGTWESLFLTLFSPATFPLNKSLAPDAGIGMPGEPRIYTLLGRASGNGSLSVFQKYGATEDAKKFSLKPHALRHLMNTELFRAGVPDTVITHQFGRTSVAQSYEYDHRTLHEKLKAIELPKVAHAMTPKGSTQEMVAKMVVAGHVEDSHLAKSFRIIQRDHGDAEAFAYLSANSDGFHITPYGFCTNSFSMNPCTRHLKCFDDCRHFAASGMEEHRITLEELRDRLKIMREVALARPPGGAGRSNQVIHATKLIQGVEAALKTQPHLNVFAAGADYSNHTKKDIFG